MNVRSQWQYGQPVIILDIGYNVNTRKYGELQRSQILEHKFSIFPTEGTRISQPVPTESISISHYDQQNGKNSTST